MVRSVTGGGSLVLLWVCLGLINLSGCGTTGGGDPSSGSLSGSELAKAEQLLAELEQAHSAGDQNQAMDVAAAILARYPTFARNDEVLVLAGDVAAKTQDVPRALDLTDQLLDRYPLSPSVPDALTRAWQLASGAGDSLRAAGYLVSLYDHDPINQTGPDGRPVATEFLRTLTPDQLSVLKTNRPTSSLQPYLSFLQVERLVLEGRNGEADALVLNMESQAGGGTWTLAARDLLAGNSDLGIIGPVRPELVGVICPLSGRFAVLGNAFYDAALLALEVTNSQHGTAFDFEVADSGGDPVAAALAARKFCRESGTVALLGAMMSDPTTAVALVADHLKVPLVSPTATNGRIWELGEGVFQTNLTGIYETRLLATLATTVMLKERFGILYPNTTEGTRNADVFRAEVEALGGQIVVEASFPSRGSDFKDPIQALRQARPEVLFVPATVDQMILLGPQLDFFHAGSLIMGLSNWNSDKLRERSGTILERAVFPNDVALFPDEWTSEFQARWKEENYAREASELALKSYQSTRMLLDTMARSGAVTRGQLVQALSSRVASRDFEAQGPESFTGTVRMFRSGNIVPFPGGRFSEGWSIFEEALSDSLSAQDGEVDADPVN